MARVTVAAPSRTYSVLAAPGALQELPRLVRELGCSGVAVITDSNVGPLWGEAVGAGFTGLGLEAPVLTLAAGEQLKSLAGLEMALEFLEASGIDRRGVVVALGGGTVGDLAGFAAATWLRGVRCVQVPTTLLAMVDSSIGGKTGVNSARAKNSIGAFWQPAAVVADLAVLGSLPRAEYLAAFAEVVKYAVAMDAGLFALLAETGPALRAGQVEALEPVISRCIELKAAVVARDERDQGARAVLNYGHTVGHALESASDFRLAHGRAVAMGMEVAVRIARDLGLCGDDLVIAQDALLRRFDLPGAPPELPATAVIEAARRDKKAVAGEIRWVLPRGIGRSAVDQRVPADLVRREVEWLLES